MRRISPRSFFYYKRLFPFVMLGIVVLMVTEPLRNSDLPPLPFVLMPLAAGAFLYFFLKKVMLDMVDEAWDAGDALIVRNKGREDRIPLSAIMNVSYAGLMNPPRVTLTLRTPSIFGDTVSFAAPLRFLPLATNPMIDDLVRRIDAARMHAR